MKLLPLFLILLLSACVTEPKITVCNGKHWWNCKHYDSERAYAEEERKATAQAVEEARDIDIDYDDCAAVVLKDMIGLNTASETKVFIVVPGGAPSEKLLAQLRSAGIPAEPKSDSSSGSDNGSVMYGMSLLSRQFWGGYTVQASYFCGMLCSGTTEYRLKKEGSSCSIVSKEQLSIS